MESLRNNRICVGKEGFYGPFNSSEVYSKMNALPEIINFLKEKDSMVVLHVGSDIYIKRYVDQ